MRVVGTLVRLHIGTARRLTHCASNCASILSGVSPAVLRAASLHFGIENTVACGENKKNKINYCPLYRDASVPQKRERERQEKKKATQQAMRQCGGLYAHVCVTFVGFFFTQIEILCVKKKKIGLNVTSCHLSWLCITYSSV